MQYSSKQKQVNLTQINFLLELLNDPDAEPVKDLSDRNKADPQTESADSTKARDKVKPGHLRGSLELWEVNSDVNKQIVESNQIQLSPQKRC